MRIGITGHQDLPPAAVPYVSQKIRQELTGDPSLVGVGSLAAGADQLFARLVLEADGRLEVILPSGDYESTFSGDSLAAYRRLLGDAVRVKILSYLEPSEEAFFAAGKAVVVESDRLIAVWDGRPAKGLGGTADIVEYARKRGRQVSVIWPEDVARD